GVLSPQPLSPAVWCLRRRHLQCGQLAASQPGAHCACASSAALPEWSRSLLGPVTCLRRLQGGRTTSASNRLGQGGSKYPSNSGTRSPKVPILNGERGTSL
ncbi:unnamed protein product, partial [Staurois parvus]